MRKIRKWMGIVSIVLFAVMVLCSNKRKANAEELSPEQGVAMETEIGQSVPNVVSPEAVVVTDGALGAYGFFEETHIKIWPGKSKCNPLFIQGEYEDLTWKVSKNEYARVDRKGKVTLKKQGAGKKFKVTAILTYTREGILYTEEYSYTVQGMKYVSSLLIESKQDYVFTGKKLKLNVVCMPKNKINNAVRFESSNKKYATVNRKGIVSPKAAGFGKAVWITVHSTDGSKVKARKKLRIIDPNKPMVALTFDDGPSYEYTSRIVNQLEKYDGHATFFVLGSHLGGRNIRKLIEKSVENGNEIASHTYDHRNLATLNTAQLQWQFTQTAQKIQAFTGKYPALVRPPYGSYGTTVQQVSTVPLILWSIDTRDWQTRNTSSTVNCVLNQVKDGDIVLMHDIYDTTASAAEQIIPELAKRGYQMVTVSELATYKKAKLQAGKNYSAIR